MDWHKHYVQQARWTHDLRTYALQKAGLSEASAVLEVGCGTGAILHEVSQMGSRPTQRAFSLHGLDLDGAVLHQSRAHEPMARLVRGDACALPYVAGAFDIVLCHFLLLWLRDPLSGLREMKRVTRQDGFVLALAEPDYSARTDSPAPLAALGHAQERALAGQGADTSIGARLGRLVDQSGLRILETGTIQPWSMPAFEGSEFAAEWEVIREDLRGMMSDGELRDLMRLDAAARRRGERVLHVPTYFALAQV